MFIPDGVDTIVEPFCGKGDLLKIVDIERNITFECYDIDPQLDDTTTRDTLLDPPSYENKFVLTNPPYLARNKATSKEAFDKYDTNDLFKCFVCSIIQDTPDGGIMIIPLNFLSSIRKGDILLRKRFLDVFDIIQINIFEERVFDDTSYTICSIQFEKKKDETADIKIDIYPSQSHIETKLTAENNYMIGGHIYNLTTNSTHAISRLTRLTELEPHTNILVKCIDDNEDNQIRLSIVDVEKVYIDKTPKLSARTYATLQIDPPISEDIQMQLVERFNRYISSERKKYNSLFLCNYRESKDIARKRISFGLVYSICQYILNQILDDQ